jgi:hypothetical protein
MPLDVSLSCKRDDAGGGFNMDIMIGRKFIEESKRTIEKNLKKRKEKSEIRRESASESDWSMINPQHINSYGIQRKDF